MKKLFVLVSCFVALLFVSNVSFAQEGAAQAAGSCDCCYCVTGATAFHAPFFPAPKVTLRDRLAARSAQKAEQAPKAGLLAARRAARSAPQPHPYQLLQTPAALTTATPTSMIEPQLPVNYMGDRNRVNQRSSVGGAPTINMFSVVRAPRDPYANYYQPAAE